MGASPSPIKLEELFSGVAQKIVDALKVVGIQEAVKQPAVKEEIAKAKVEAGQKALWQAFPVILIGFLAIWAIKKF